MFSLFRPELTFELICVTCLVIGAVTLMLSLVLPARLAFVIAVVKGCLPFVYFAFFFDGQWTILDDAVYFKNAQDLLDHGFNPILSIADIHFYVRLLMLSHGIHFLYSWWNMLAMWVLGPHYWAPVYFNIVTSAVAVVTLDRLLSDVKLPGTYRLGAACFFALNPEILAWSSALNLKDVLVMALSLSALRALVHICAGRVRFATILSALASLVALGTVRFYVPILMVGTASLWTLTSFRVIRRPWAGGILVVGFLGLFGWLGAHIDSNISSLQFAELAPGLVRFLLTPQPWSLAREYTFLLIPSIVNWVATPLILFGVVRLWRDVPQLRLLYLYTGVVAAFYAVLPNLQGPRQRIQLIPILSLALFHGVYRLLTEALALRSTDNRVVSADATSAAHVIRPPLAQE